METIAILTIRFIRIMAAAIDFLAVFKVFIYPSKENAASAILERIRRGYMLAARRYRKQRQIKRPLYPYKTEFFASLKT